MKKAIIKVVFALAGLGVLGMYGCVTVPPQTAELSAQISGQIAAGRKAHQVLIDEYEKQRQARIDDYMQYIWTPRFIKNFLNEEPVANALKSEVCGAAGKCQMDRAMVVQEIVETISARVESQRKTLQDALYESVYVLRAGVRDHYDRMERMNNAVTSNLRSVVKDQKMRDKVLEALNLPTKDILPIKEAGMVLDRLLGE